MYMLESHGDGRFGFKRWAARQEKKERHGKGVDIGTTVKWLPQRLLW